MAFNKYLIIIAGPTAVGKSGAALQVADFLQTEIVSADSRQIYRGLDIGTAKVSKRERDRVPHHLIDICDITDKFTAADFEREALLSITRIHEQNDTAILCGGTGLYMHAVRNGLDDIPNVPESVAAEWDKKYHQQGIGMLQEALRMGDPAYYQRVDIQNQRRLIRALSVISHTGKPFSSFLRDDESERPFEVVPLLLDLDREILYHRINKRVDWMVDQGLETESRTMLPYRELQALQTVGYQEWFPYFDGDYDRQEAIRLIKRNSRRYAKRQGTWFRGHGPWITLAPEDVLPWVKDWSDRHLAS